MAKRMVRKRFIISGLCLILTSLFYVMQSNGAFADIAEGRRCKTMFNGECTEYFAPVLQTSVEENSQQNIEQTQMEAYQPAPYKYIPQTVTKKDCINGFGIGIVIDPYQNVWSTWEVYNQSKIFIIYVEQNSPAQKAGLKVGDEILRINGTRAVKFKDSDAVISYMHETPNLELQIRRRSGGKDNITLSASNICTTKNIDPLLETYWSQVTDKNVEYAASYLDGVGKVTGKLTPQLRSEFYKYQREVLDLSRQKNSFTKGYNLCAYNAVSEQALHHCLENLVNRSLGIITHEQNMQLQQENIETQRQINAQQVNAINNVSNAINNHSYALQNQNVNVYHNGSVDVNHSGTVNVNGNYNVNGRYSIYHY